jgi:geranylgeranyl reductase family protein
MDSKIFDSSYDVAIVGAGPAGSSAAIRLANAGRKVLLIDKAQFPRHKLCGEFVSPECLDHLKDLGVFPRIDKASPTKINKTVFYSSGGRSFSIPSRWLARNNADSIGLSRRALDQILLDRAAECGASVRTEVAVLDVSTGEGQSIQLSLRTIGGSIYEITAPIMIDATGRGRYVARRFDKGTSNTKPRQVAFKVHLRGAAIEHGACEIFSYPGGYGGCSSVEDGLYNLCFVVNSELVRAIGSDPLKVLKETVLKNQRAASVLADIEIEGNWITVPIARYGSLDPAPAPGILAIGDAAAFIDPFTGSGIAMALESSRIASDAILRSKVPETIATEYRRSHTIAFRKRLMVCRGLRLLSSSPKLADVALAVLARSAPLGRYIARLTRTSTSIKELHAAE